MKDQAWLQSVERVRGNEQQWIGWLAERLPQELRGAIVHVRAKGEELNVQAVSAAWGARLRFALDALLPQLQQRAARIVKVRIRVAPAGRSGAQK